MPAKRPQGGKTGRGSYGKKDGKYSDRGGKKESGYGEEKKRGSSSDKRSDRKTAGSSKGGYSKKSYGDDDRKAKSFGGRDKKFGDKKTSFGSKGGYAKKSYNDEGDDRKKGGRSFGDRDKKFGDKKSSFGSKGGYEKKSYSDDWDDRKKSGKSFGDPVRTGTGGRDKKFGDKKTGGFKRKDEGDYGDRKRSSFGDSKKSGSFKDYRSKKRDGFKDEGYKTDSFSSKKRSYDEDELNDAVDYTEKKRSFEKKKGEYDKMIRKSERNYGKPEKKDDGTIRLNKYLSNSGVASRRDADKLIESGAVTVNGVVVTELGTKIKLTDKVQYGGQSVKTEKLVYILLNKPKDYITTMDDPQGRKTVMSLIRGAAKERVYPVGRLDRNTTGVLLFTNDGELTRRLTHPKFLVSKMYHVTLDKNFAKEDLEQMRKGLELEDGYIKPDQLEYSGETKKELGIEIHSGRNRIVRRMFEHLGYDVVKLDRVQFAGLNKKDIPRGKWRFLGEKEVGFLKML